MAVPQLEDGQLRLGRVRVHDPVRRDAEPLVCGFLPVKVDERGAGRADLHDQQRWLGELSAADLVHADHHEIGIELGLRPELDGWLGHDAQVFRTGPAQHAVQSSRHHPMNRRRPRAHDERERAADRGPSLGDGHDTHSAPFCTRRLLCQAPVTFLSVVITCS
jgi:hypothetical protein